MFAAFIGATICGVILGLLRGRYRGVDAASFVPTEVIRPIPPLGFIPLFILWFGIGELSKILIIFYYVMMIVMLNTQAGVKGTERSSGRFLTVFAGKCSRLIRPRQQVSV